MQRRITFIFLLLVITCGSIHAQEASRERPIITFKGNQVFSEKELRDVAETCMTANQRTGLPDSTVLYYCLERTRHFLSSKGYLQATIDDGTTESTTNGARLVVTVHEGAQFRLGRLDIEGSKVMAPAQLREMLDLKTGEIVDADRIFSWLFERIKASYANFGYLQYTAESKPTFTLPKEEPTGVVDFKINIDEGPVFVIRSIRFEGNVGMSQEALRRLMLVRQGEAYNQGLLDQSLRGLNLTGLFLPIDANKDLEYKSELDSAQVDLTIHLRKQTNQAEVRPDE
jgi:outer membrane protein insertion porin family